MVMKIKNNSKISIIQLNIILIIAIPTTSLLFILSDVYKDAKQDMWVSLLLISLYCMIFSVVITTLAKMFKRKNLVEICEAVIGKIPGKIIGFIFVGYYIHLTAVLVREFSDFLNGSLYYETPNWFFSICILIPCVFMLYKGIETTARVGQFIIMIFSISIFFILSLSFYDANISNLTPILSNSPESIFNGSIRLIIWVGEFLILLYFMPYIEKTEKLTSSVLIAILIMAILIIPISISLVAIFGPLTEYLSYPFLSLTRYVSVAREARIDTFILIMWVSTLFFKFAIFLYCGIQSAATIYNKDYKYFILPVAIITLILSQVLWVNPRHLKDKILTEYSLIYTIIQIGIPTLILVIAKLKKLLLKKQ